MTADVPLLATESADLSESITTHEYNRLPLIQVGRMRQPANFLFLTPGAHRSLKQNTEVLVDGLSGGQSRTIGSMNEMSPPVDAVREFKVQSSQVSAEYGHSGAAVVNLTIKSGTGELHGSGFEYFRNDKLDARSWFAPSRAITRQNEFGATAGGPIWLPKLYNGRDRSFFFFAYSGSRKRGMDNIERVRIPAPEFIRGDFSGLLGSSGRPQLVYDPKTTRADGRGGFLRDPFPGNRIAGDRIDPVAAKVAALFPGPNTSGAGSLNYQDWIGEQKLDPDLTTAKVDHMISARQKFFSTFNWNRIPRVRNRVPLPLPISHGFVQDITSRVFRFNHDFFARPNLLNTLSLGYNRFRNPNGTPTINGGWADALGLKGVPGQQFPGFSFTNGYAALGNTSYGDSIDQTYFLRDAITWSRGRHAAKAGLEIRWNQWNDKSQSNASGTCAFNSLDNGVNPAFRLREGFPQNFSREPKIDPAILNNQNASYLESNAGAMPRTQNWSLGFQRELSANLMFEAIYLGNHNTRQVEPQIVNINQLHPRYLSLGSVLTNSITSQAARDAGIKSPYAGFSGSVAQALRAYPQYRTLTAGNAKAGKSIYHALQMRLEKRFARGLSFDVSYTLSKNIGYNNPSYAGRGGADTVLQDNWNRGLERAILPFDIPHAFLVHYSYDLPFKGKGWTTRLVEGWSLSGIQRYQSGNPLPILMQNTLPIFNRALRPDRLSGKDAATRVSASGFQPNRDRLIDPGAFAAPAPFRFGSSEPYIQDLRNFTVFAEDLSLIKTTRVSERVSSEILVQFINVFNRHRFGEVDGNFSNASFGQVKSASFPRFIQLGARIRF